MHLMQRHDIDIDFWPSCNQVWLDRVEIDKLGRIQSSHIETDDNKHHYKKSAYSNILRVQPQITTKAKIP
jgi:Zn-finger nucleic acid-binding protein